MTPTYYSERTKRSPRSLERPPGEMKSRSEVRQSLAESLQPPPRTTRYDPLAAPVGLV